MGRIAALVVGTAIALSGCDSVTCENEISARLPSPAGRLEAVVFERGCGATTDFNTQLSIVPVGGMPEAAGNALILDDSVPLTLAWQNERELRVTGLGSSRPLKQEGSVQGVSVSYHR
jgi:hypothetical protein